MRPDDKGLMTDEELDDEICTYVDEARVSVGQVLVKERDGWAAS